ncbi:MAG: cellulase, partial [bacterium]|nr:cellulase [bacterium]
PVDGNGAPAPAYRAFQLYRNADGMGRGFGDTSVTAASPLPKVAIYGALDSSTGALTVVVINKDSAPLAAPLSLVNFDAAATAKVWQVVEGGAPTTPADYAISSGTLALAIPAHAMQLIVAAKR